MRHLYGNPEAIRAYAAARADIELDDDRDMADLTVAAEPWPSHPCHDWNSEDVLTELIHLHERSVRRARPWDGNIDF